MMFPFRNLSPGPRNYRPQSATTVAAAIPFFAAVALPLYALCAFSRAQDWLAMIHDGTLWKPLLLTLATASTAVFLSVLAGLPAAYCLSRRLVPLTGLLDILVDLPLALPPVVTGVALLLAFGRYGLFGKYLSAHGIQISFTTLAVVVAQFVVSAPYFVRSAKAGFEALDARWEEQAFVLGASGALTFFCVTLPLIRRSLLAGVLMTAARALSEFGATMMFAGNMPGRTQTLSLAVMAQMEVDIHGATVLSCVSLLLALCLLLAARAAGRAGLAGHQRTGKARS